MCLEIEDSSGLDNGDDDGSTIRKDISTDKPASYLNLPLQGPTINHRMNLVIYM